MVIKTPPTLPPIQTYMYEDTNMSDNNITMLCGSKRVATRPKRFKNHMNVPKKCFLQSHKDKNTYQKVIKPTDRL